MGRWRALIEVGLAFALMHVAFRSFKRFTTPGQWEWRHDANFSPAASMLAVASIFILMRRRAWSEHAIARRGIGADANVALAACIVYSAVGAIALACGLQHDRTWTDATFGLLAACLSLAVSALIAVALWRWSARIERWPRLVGVAFVLVVPALWAASALDRGGSIPGVAISLTSIILGAAVGEEVFFRGYMQSRLNEAFGRSWRILGVRCGPGLFIAAGLFGLVHVLNTFDYFRWEGRLAWWWGATAAASLYLGVLRERTGSVSAPIIVHAFIDLAAQAVAPPA